MKRYKLIVKFLLFTMLLITGVNICSAQNCQKFTVIIDVNTGNQKPVDITLCDHGAGIEYCVAWNGGDGYILEGVMDCSAIGETWYYNPLPVGDASILLLLFSGIYGFFIFRKRD